MDASRFPATIGRQPQEGSMALELLAIDLGKRSFHLYGIDTNGEILSRKVSRTKLAEVVNNLAPKAIAMEACASAHYWARCWLAAGREVRLINPRFVKPFVKGSKNDAVDAEAIFEAAMRPTDALRAGEVEGPAGPAIASSGPRPADLPTHGFDQPYARPPCRIWGRVAARPVALHCAGTGRRRRCRVVRSGAIDLRRTDGPIGRARSSGQEARRDDGCPVPHE